MGDVRKLIDLGLLAQKLDACRTDYTAQLTNDALIGLALVAIAERLDAVLEHLDGASNDKS